MTGLELSSLNGAFVAILDGREMGLVTAIERAQAETRDCAYLTWLDHCSGSDLYTVVDHVAVIGVYGSLVPNLPFHGSDYITGYNCIRIAVSAALRDADVSAIALDISSPGGIVSGCFELCEFLREVREEKPVMAIVRDLAASAAYAIASTAHVIAAPETGAVGSIGVFRLHGDFSKMFEDVGINLSQIYSGARKVDGSPYMPLSDDARAKWQGVVDEYRELFAKHVSAGRDVSVADILSTEAELYDGPSNLNRAREIGLIDQIMSPDQAFAALVKSIQT
ncbi:S49 family peptidase [Roseibium sediminicola]|uniref:S49 family peptidase n=1 Tax=Roseibium sediminicola TaxID=2933272 RepID=A0ABT0H279_9HYPH|nr:S49 family peptidase [Roseibium sp. CAU 1639]MCK7615190.1 S49 family peptidase [Roseibium sp. CAU 1639]